ncbi:TetR/AcrR family transcriptional regulator C-terminal domain-containing protein [Streptomyces rubellomurinus]|uniref:TetR/AcrR family transcriptional regulator C-terminal domain-containing protein n=1 Tax=Streptomyces sp. Y1 TaxID=3238634 RepID=A0AB39TM06_9ACTN|nr:TetR/AcrR family transcriptional regulator C-terminal domain-containing protein [Streptomyces rubellomurinus]
MTAKSEDEADTRRSAAPRKGKDAGPGITNPWARPQRPRREQPVLSREQIVQEALALLDAEGVEALSMRKLGTRLNAGATSLYTHVANKDELLALVVDQVFGELPMPRAEGAEQPEVWRAAVEGCAEDMRACMLRHPWMVSVMGDVGMVYFGPSWMRVSEAMLALMETAGFEPREANDAMGAVIGYTIGSASVEAAWLSALKRSGRDEQEFMDEMLPAVIEATKDYPRLHRLYHTAVQQDVADGRDSGFLTGVRLVLDGVEAALKARQQQG